MFGGIGGDRQDWRCDERRRSRRGDVSDGAAAANADPKPLKAVLEVLGSKINEL